MSILETHRLTLRRFMFHDTDDLYEILADPEAMHDAVLSGTMYTRADHRLERVESMA